MSYTWKKYGWLVLDSTMDNITNCIKMRKWENEKAKLDHVSTFDTMYYLFVPFICFDMFFLELRVYRKQGDKICVHFTLTRGFLLLWYWVLRHKRRHLSRLKYMVLMIRFGSTNLMNLSLDLCHHWFQNVCTMWIYAMNNKAHNFPLILIWDWPKMLCASLFQKPFRPSL